MAVCYNRVSENSVSWAMTDIKLHGKINNEGYNVHFMNELLLKNKRATFSKYKFDSTLVVIPSDYYVGDWAIKIKINIQCIFLLFIHIDNTNDKEYNKLLPLLHSGSDLEYSTLYTMKSIKITEKINVI